MEHGMTSHLPDELWTSLSELTTKDAGDILRTEERLHIAEGIVAARKKMPAITIDHVVYAIYIVGILGTARFPLRNSALLALKMLSGAGKINSLDRSGKRGWRALATNQKRFLRQQM